MQKKYSINYFFFSLLICSIYLSQVNGQGILNKTFSVNLDKVKIESAVKTVSNLTHVKFNYSTGSINLSSVISYHATNKRIIDFINEILLLNGISYQEVNGTIVLFPSKKGISPNINTELQKVNSNTVYGIVKDEKGITLEGVTITEKGTSNRVITNKKGEFIIKTSDSNTELVISYIGYATIEVALKGNKDVLVNLTPNAKALDDVIIVGYGTQQKRLVSTSISSIDATKISDLPITNVSQAIAGQIAGVDVQSISGSPGTAPIIRIRGIGSLGAGNDPLYVVDGYPLSSSENFEQINPSDIEKIEVLKDAAAAAIYGSRGGNGVIIVTTKRGRMGKTGFSFSISTSLDNVSKKMSLLNSTQFADYETDVRKSQSATVPTWITDTSKWAATDWQSLIFRQVLNPSYQLTASGGNSAIRYSISGAITNQNGIILGTRFKRYSFRSNTDIQLSKRLKISINIAPSYTTRDDRPVSGDNITSYYSGGVPNLNQVQGNGSFSTVLAALMMSPLIPEKLPNGDYNQHSTDPNTKGSFLRQDVYNPLAVAEQFSDNTIGQRLLSNISIEYEIIKDLKCRANVGVETNTTTRNFFVPSYIAWNNAPSATYSNANLNGISAGQKEFENSNWLWENTFS